MRSFFARFRSLFFPLVVAISAVVGAMAAYPEGVPGNGARIAPYDSDAYRLDNLPSVVEFQVQATGDTGQAAESRARGVALAGNGAILALASSFQGAADVRVAGDGETNTCRGWLARDGQNGWIVVRVWNPVIAAVTVSLSRQAVSEDRGLLVVLPTRAGNREPNVLSALPASGPDRTAFDPSASAFWIAVSPEALLPGTPVLDEERQLVGLIDAIRPDLHLARVRRAGAPLDAFSRAVLQVEPLDWRQEPPDPARSPFPPEPGLAAAAKEIQGASGPALASSCDALLRQNSASPAAWYLAYQGYVRAGLRPQAEASARMLTQLASQRWESWFAYAGQLEAANKLDDADDAYETALGKVSPRFYLHAPGEESGAGDGDSGPEGHHGHRHGGGGGRRTDRRRPCHRRSQAKREERR